MNEIKFKQPIISIYSKVPINKELIDIRVGYSGLSFGTVKNICQQYGVKYEKQVDSWKFTAPKSRLQLFAEKLHFSATYYREQPFD
ncbi:MAG: hypothetical protein ACOCWG_00740 [bacterium]